MSQNSHPVLAFLGTPEFALPTLRMLLDSGEYALDCVITQTDKPAGRGQKLTSPIVKEYALRRGVKVFQPSSLKTITTEKKNGAEKSPLVATQKSQHALIEYLNSLPALDAFISVAYGKIIPDAFFQFARYGVINIHPSLLPRWRGAAPIQRAISAGDEETGISIMQADAGWDTGPVFAKRPIAILSEDTYGTLHDRLAEEGARFLLEILPRILSGALPAQPQGSEGVTLADKWESNDLTIDWATSAIAISRQIRASSPSPGARSIFSDASIKILRAHVVRNNSQFPPAPPGAIVDCNKRELIVATGSPDYISLDEIQFPGRKALPIGEALRGQQFSTGMRFG